MEGKDGVSEGGREGTCTSNLNRKLCNGESASIRSVPSVVKPVHAGHQSRLRVSTLLPVSAKPARE